MALPTFLRVQLQDELSFWQKVQGIFKRLETSNAATLQKLEAEMLEMQPYDSFWLNTTKGDADYRVEELKERLAS